MTRHPKRQKAPAASATALSGTQPHPFATQEPFSADRIGQMHDMALRLLEELGISVLDDESRALFKSAGARVDGDMVFLGREIVAAALASAPRKITLSAPNPARNLALKLGRMTFGPGAGCPNVTDRTRRSRPARLPISKTPCACVSISTRSGSLAPVASRKTCRPQPGLWPSCAHNLPCPTRLCSCLPVGAVR